MSFEPTPSSSAATLPPAAAHGLDVPDSGFTPLAWVESPGDLGLRVSRLLGRSRRQGDRVSVLWLRLEMGEAGTPPVTPALRAYLMRTFGARLFRSVRSTDEVVQIGTHEYALLLTANKAESAVVEKRLRHQWLERDPLEGSGVRGRVSLGAASFPEDGRSGVELALAAKAGLQPLTGTL
ncbi:GGDEF domain-containing protein [Roseateles paludis]|uniref:GGDEF domain-containing protein n=1 Tax=Roseateles paludis TaxID=3145238 RepID=A0ABV0G569_9BURK